MVVVLAAINLGFGLAVAEICQPLDQQQSHRGMACPKSATQSLLNIVISSLIGLMWRK
jgi:hypothetical protein